MAIIAIAPKPATSEPAVLAQMPRERLRLAFGGDALFRLTELQHHGVCAELDFPAPEKPA